MRKKVERVGTEFTDAFAEEVLKLPATWNNREHSEEVT